MLKEAPNRTPQGIAAWRAKLAKASQTERDMFLEYKAGDLQQYATAIESSVKDHGKNSRALRVAHLLNPLFETMNMYAPIAQTMIQADPTSSSLILGAITCVMAISKRFEEYQEKIAKMLSEMLGKLEILTKYGENIYKNNGQMQQAIIDVYGDVLDFCVQASRLFLDDKGNERNSLKTFLTSLGKSFEVKFSDVLYRFDRHLKAFEATAMYVDRERQVADRNRMNADRAVMSQFMRYQAYGTHEILQGTNQALQGTNQVLQSTNQTLQGTNQILQDTSQIHRGVISIGQQMSAADQRHREEEQKARMEAIRVKGTAIRFGSVI